MTNKLFKTDELDYLQYDHVQHDIKQEFKIIYDLTTHSLTIVTYLSKRPPS